MRGGRAPALRGVGDIVVGNVKRADPADGIKQGEVVTGVMVRTKAAFRRDDGTYICLTTTPPS